MHGKLHRPGPYLIDDDAPELTEEDFARARPASEVLPKEIYEGLVAAYEAPQREKKLLVSLRLDGDVIDHFRKGGRFWQRRINEALRRAVERDEAAARS